MEQVPATEEADLELEAAAANQSCLGYEAGSKSLEEILGVYEGLANKVDQVISNYIEAGAKTENGIENQCGVRESSMDKSNRTGTGMMPRPKFRRSIFRARSAYVYALDDKYNKADRYEVKALHDLINGTAAAVRLYETAERDYVEEVDGTDKAQLMCAATLLNSALMARLFRPSSQTLQSFTDQTMLATRVTEHALSQEATLVVVTSSLGHMKIQASDPNAIYEKIPLAPGNSLIRVLDLYHGSSDDHLSGTLRVVDLNSQPKYEALSYVWGDPKISAPMTVNNASVNVTRNLAVALKRLRLSSTIRCIWVDALCINQVDKAEKQQQIGLMRRIYASAMVVTIWLGEPWPVKETALVRCTHEFLHDMQRSLTPAVAASLLPYLDPMSGDTVEGKAMRQAETQTAGFRKTLERLPSVLLPNRTFEAYADDMSMIFPDNALPGLVLAGAYDAMERMNTAERFRDLHSFNRWARSSRAAPLNEYDWDNNGSIARILNSTLDADQWPVVGALCIINQLALDYHLHDLPFFEKDTSYLGQAWPKSASKLHELLAKPYWGRAWILQEVILGRSPIIHFGAHKIPFVRLAIAQRNYFKHARSCCRTVVYGSSLERVVPQESWWYKLEGVFFRLTYIFDMWAKAEQQRRDHSADVPKFDFMELLSVNTGKRKASDPRDMVYATLGLFTNADGYAIMEADYSLSTAQVFARTTVQIHRRQKSLGLLGWPCFRTKNPFRLPSWTPDFTSNLDQAGHHEATMTARPQEYHACLNTAWNGELLDDLCLSAQSYRLDVIDRISPRFDLCIGSSVNDLQKQLSMWYRFAFLDFEETDSQSRESEHWDVNLVAKKVRQEFIESQTSRKREFLRMIIGKPFIPEASRSFGVDTRAQDDDISLIEEWWYWLTGKPPGHSEDGHNEKIYRNWMAAGQKYVSVHSKCVNNTFHKRLFVTKLGRLGLGLSSYTKWGLVAWPTAFQGDEIHVLEGCDLPVLLRPLADIREKGTADVTVTKPRNAKSEAESAQSESTLKANSAIYSAPLDKCSHKREQVFQFSGQCYVEGLMDGAVFQDGKLRPSTIYLR